ncbi:MAG: hypothetical protein QOE00_279 [Ilumatobacteraceae bacterium]
MTITEAALTNRGTAKSNGTPADLAKEVVTTFFDRYRIHDVHGMVDLCTDDADFRYVPYEVWLRTRVVRADEKVATVGKPLWTHLIGAFPDLTNNVESMTADDDGNVAVQVDIGGTQAKSFGAIACHELRYDLPHLFLFHVDRDGLIDRIVAYWDTADWYRQLGKVEAD